MGDKIAGLKEQLVGKVKKDPALVEHGKQRKTGELNKNREPVRPIVYAPSH